MNRLLRSLVAAIIASVALAGCTGGDGGGEIDQEVPGEITQQDFDKLEELAGAAFPNIYSFPDQQILPSVHEFYESTMPTGTGVVSPEYPYDWGFIAANQVYETYDLSSMVPVGQPVEIRMELKWVAGPAASGDFDIYVNVPGYHDAFQDNRYDESFNWNRVTKARVVNTVHLEGQPFEVGVEFSNGKTYAGGVDYTLQVDIFFAHDVLAPRAPYAVTLPDGASGFILESEPIAGDEHITSSILIIGPDDQPHAYVLHNDIGTETLFISATQPGEYVFYAHYFEGGFIRIETDIPNEFHETRLLEAEVTTNVVKNGGAPAPGTYEEQCTPRIGFSPSVTVCPGDDPPFEGLLNEDSFASTGAVSLPEGRAPLEIFTFLEITAGGTLDAAIKVLADQPGEGDDAVSATWAVASSEPTEGNRVGFPVSELRNHGNLLSPSFTWGVVDNGGNVGLGYGVITYVR